MRHPFVLAALCLGLVPLAGCGSDSSTGSKSSAFSADSSVFTDSRDGHAYRTTKIGAQRWFAQSLNFAADSSTCYNNSADSCTKYGRLYPWQVAMAVDTSFARASRGSSDSLHHQGVCPAGWRIPSPGDWATLVRVAGNSHDDSAAIRLKADSLWSTKGNNASGFNALPAGQRNDSRTFEQLGAFVDFWLSTEENATRANVAYLQNSNMTKSSSSYKIQAFSVRCILQ